MELIFTDTALQSADTNTRQTWQAGTQTATLYLKLNDSTLRSTPHQKQFSKSGRRVHEAGHSAAQDAAVVYVCVCVCESVHVSRYACDSVCACEDERG